MGASEAVDTRRRLAKRCRKPRATLRDHRREFAAVHLAALAKRQPHPDACLVARNEEWLTPYGVGEPCCYVVEQIQGIAFRYGLVDPDDQSDVRLAKLITEHRLRGMFVGIVALPDREIFDAMIWVMERCKLVLEGAAAAPVAALLHGLVRLPVGSKVAVVLSGGNVNLDQLRGLNWN